MYTLVEANLNSGNFCIGLCSSLLRPCSFLRAIFPAHLGHLRPWGFHLGIDENYASESYDQNILK